ncbi:MAG: tRNA (adenosine(37)-N6)-threonylcarbamoyltransferase complex transferase subunit TsaD, partial [Burkholderiales bacterium]|nr:tRNA (adenosine(37)-N6)-threonylcarbamoyltransferase complex transferase subunit TsaD [Burkholderiales bacterium]
RERLSASARRKGFSVFYPELEFCTDNGAMIALAGTLRLERSSLITHHSSLKRSFTVRPRWDLASLETPEPA